MFLSEALKARRDNGPEKERQESNTGSDFNVTHFFAYREENLDVASLDDHVSDITTVIKSLEWLRRPVC